MKDPKPEAKDYAEILRKHFSAAQSTTQSPYRMSKRNKAKLERIRAKVRQMRGGR